MALSNILQTLYIWKRQKLKVFYEKKTIKNTKIKKRTRADKCYASTCNVEILNSFNPELHLKDCEPAIGNKLKDLLTELKRFKYVMTLVSEFKKLEVDDERKYSTFYLPFIQPMINESNNGNVFESIYGKFISSIQKSLAKGLSWIIDSVVKQTTNFLTFNPLSVCSYTKLLKVLDN